jgi:D-tyrosyl-tRNA(Tyr) deacylase
MRVVLQRVTAGSVHVDGVQVGAVAHGFVALVGITHADSEDDVLLLARKTAHLRVFDDEDGRMNRSVLDVGGGVLVISQFTLYADMQRGRRPGFTDAALPDSARPLVDRYAQALRDEGIARVETGVFGAMMHVEIHNNGPVTLLLDSREFT